MPVAQLRGAVFELDADDDRLDPVDDGTSRDIAWQAVSDLSEWLDFGCVEEYLEALYTERARIFDRARD